MLIHELAKKSGTGIHTIRFYLKKGLLGPEDYTICNNGYKYFNENALETLHLVKAGKNLGFSLKEMTLLIKQFKDGSISSARKKEILMLKIEELDQKISLLEKMRKYLNDKITKL